MPQTNEVKRIDIYHIRDVVIFFFFKPRQKLRKYIIVFRNTLTICSDVRRGCGVYTTQLLTGIDSVILLNYILRI